MATTASVDLGRLDDAQLVGLTQNGDQEAFAVLYDRYFDRVYDFLARMMRNRAEAEDVAQDTFIRAINGIDRLESGHRFKSWLFTIARNTALNRIERERRNRPLAFADDEGEDVELDLIDYDQFGSPEEAARAGEIAALVWEAAAGLSPKQYSLLDLHLRQGLDSAEIADVLGVTRNNGYVMLNRLRSAVEESIGAYVMMREGRRRCSDLDAALEEAGIGGVSPKARRLVTNHVAQCETCRQVQSEIVSPAAILGAFVPIEAAADTRATILSRTLEQWQGLQPAPRQGADAQPTVRAPTASREAAGWVGKAALAGALAMIAGVVLLGMALLDPFASDAAPASEAAGATIRFQTESGKPVSGVGLAIEFTPAGPGEERVMSAESDASGVVSLSNNGAGTYVVRIESLPEQYAAADLDQLRAFTVDAGEEVEIVATFKATPS